MEILLQLFSLDEAKPGKSSKNERWEHVLGCGCILVVACVLGLAIYGLTKLF